MPWDLQLSPYGDLVFAGNRDIAIVTSADLIRQRMMLRLKVPKGTYKGNKDLGSEMRSLMRAGNTSANRSRGVAIVTQALRPMDDITVNSVEVTPDEYNVNGIIVEIEATARIPRGQAQFLTEPFVVTIPVMPLATENPL